MEHDRKSSAEDGISHSLDSRDSQEGPWSHRNGLAKAYKTGWGLVPFGSDRKRGVGVMARWLVGSSLKVRKLAGEVGQPVLVLFQMLLSLPLDGLVN